MVINSDYVLMLHYQPRVINDFGFLVNTDTQMCTLNTQTYVAQITYNIFVKASVTFIVRSVYHYN